MPNYRRLLAYLRPYVWPQGVFAVGFMLAFSAVEGSLPFLAKYFFDRGTSPQHPEALPLAVVSIVTAAFLRGGFDFGASYLNDWIGGRVVADLRNELTAHMPSLDLAFYNRRRAGQIVSRVTADVTLARALVTDAVTSIFEDAARLLFLVVGAIWLDWTLALVAVCLFPAAALPIRYVSKQLRQTGRRT